MCFPGLSVRHDRIVEVSVILAVTALIAAITDVRRFLIIPAFIGFIHAAEIVTVLRTGIAIHLTVHISANVTLAAVLRISAVVAGEVAATDENTVFPDLIGDRTHMPV